MVHESSWTVDSLFVHFTEVLDALGTTMDRRFQHQEETLKTAIETINAKIDTLTVLVVKNQGVSEGKSTTIAYSIAAISAIFGATSIVFNVFKHM